MTEATRRRLLRLAPGALLCGAVLWLAPPAVATTIHGDFIGTNYDYLGVQETSTFTDPEPLFGAPIIVGDSLVFTPGSFSAFSNGGACETPTPQPGCNNGVDQTGAQLQATIMATGGLPLDTITITEFGEVNLTGVGTAATGAFISMSGLVTVLETAGGGPCVSTPTVSCITGFTGTFNPTDLYELPGDLGQTLFQGDVLVDLSAPGSGAHIFYPGYSDVTKAFLSFDNDMMAYSESGTTALIEKKPTIVISLPEPGTVLLFGSAALAFALRARRRFTH